MKKWSAFSLMVILTSLITSNVLGQKVELLKTTLLSHYPSASGISFFENKLYVIGDDAKHILIVDTSHRTLDSIILFPMNTYRIPWDKKPDMESLFIGHRRGQAYLIGLPSFSSPIRNKIVLMPLADSKQTKILDFPHPATRLKELEIAETNIEGSTIVGKNIILSNRANLSQPYNYLVLIRATSKGVKRMKGWSKMECILPAANGVTGLSGLEYIKERDLLLFTASTEATASANADGAIGNSYLGMIENFSKKTKQNRITPDQMINLSQQLQIGPQKLEGITVAYSTDTSLMLHIVADNDDGKSIIYKVLFTR